MKLRRGKAKYKVPPHSRIEQVCLESRNACNIKLQPLLATALNRDGILGVPTSFCIWHDMIEFWPVPDASYTVRGYYLPPMEVF